MPNEESKPKGISGVLQDGMSPEGSEKQTNKGGRGKTIKEEDHDE